MVHRPITLKEPISFFKMLENTADDLGSLREIIVFCGLFLTLREGILYFVH
jgi:hypothetical protein